MTDLPPITDEELDAMLADLEASGVVLPRCPSCGGPVGGRVDAVYCSGACRQRAYRERTARLG